MLEHILKKKAIIFDMDGVIVDNINYHIEATKVFFKRLGQEISDEYFQKHMNGRTIQEMILKFKPEATQAEILSLSEEKELLYRKLYGKNLSATKGLIEFLESLKQRNIKLAVATSAITANADFTLDGLSIRHYFDVVIDSTMVIKGKPDPQIYLKAAESLGVAPEECLVFEDALAGIEAASNAGMDVIALTTSLSKEELPHGLSYIIKDFKAFQS